MTRISFGAAAALVATISMATAAQAADLSYGYGSREPYTVAQPLNSYSWAGPYLGGNIGYNWGDITGNPTHPSGFTGGVQGGFNYQSGALVIGLEGDLQLNGADDTFATWKFSNPWFGTVRGRVGYSMGNLMVYGTGGLAFGELHATSLGMSESHTSAGWTIGAGAEFGLSQNWSAKVEYLYVDLSNSRFTITGLPNGYEFGLVRFGVNYHF